MGKFGKLDFSGLSDANRTLAGLINTEEFTDTRKKLKFIDSINSAIKTVNDNQQARIAAQEAADLQDQKAKQNIELEGLEHKHALDFLGAEQKAALEQLKFRNQLEKESYTQQNNSMQSVIKDIENIKKLTESGSIPKEVLANLSEAAISRLRQNTSFDEAFANDEEELPTPQTAQQAEALSKGSGFFDVDKLIESNKPPQASGISGGLLVNDDGSPRTIINPDSSEEAIIVNKTMERDRQIYSEMKTTNKEFRRALSNTTLSKSQASLLDAQKTIYKYADVLDDKDFRKKYSILQQRLNNRDSGLLGVVNSFLANPAELNILLEKQLKLLPDDEKAEVIQAISTINTQALGAFKGEQGGLGGVSEVELQMVREALFSLSLDAKASRRKIEKNLLGTIHDKAKDSFRLGFNDEFQNYVQEYNNLAKEFDIKNGFKYSQLDFSKNRPQIEDVAGQTINVNGGDIPIF